MAKKIKKTINKILAVLALLVIVAGIMFISKPVKLPFEGYVENDCNFYENTVLNSMSAENMATGNATKKMYDNKVFTQVQANLPETQATFELTYKDNCECDCNNLFDCACGGKPGCPFYLAHLINEKNGKKITLGKMKKFRDGVYRVSNSFKGPELKDHNKILVTFEGNVGKIGNDSIPVLLGNFKKTDIYKNHSMDLN